MNIATFERAIITPNPGTSIEDCCDLTLEDAGDNAIIYQFGSRLMVLPRVNSSSFEIRIDAKPDLMKENLLAVSMILTIPLRIVSASRLLICIENNGLIPIDATLVGEVPYLCVLGKSSFEYVPMCKVNDSYYEIGSASIDGLTPLLFNIDVLYNMSPCDSPITKPYHPETVSAQKGKPTVFDILRAM